MVQTEGVRDEQILNGVCARVPSATCGAGARWAQRQRCGEGVWPARHDSGQVGTPEPNGCASGMPPSRNNVPQGPLNAAERQELVELRRKLRQVQMERDILAKACAPGLPAKASGRLQRLPARESKPGPTTRARPVRNAQGLHQRILRLAGSPAEQTGASQRGLARAHPPSPPRQRRDLWHAPYSCRAGRYRRHCQAQANCLPPAGDGPPGRQPQARLCVTTERNKRQRPAPDLVKRVFVAQDINELWVADMTYVSTW